MSSLRFVGAAPSEDTDVVSKLSVNNLLNAVSPGQTSVSTAVAAAAAPLASKTYVTGQDLTFKLASYYQAQDLLNVPLASKGQPNGVATLDGTGKVPLGQIPALGSGYILGPFSPTALFPSSATAPVKIADWNIGVQSVSFHALAFCIVVASCAAGGRPMVEIKMSNGQQSYASQTLIGIGVGRSLYVDNQPIVVLPAPATTGQSASTGWPVSTNIWATAWLSDLNGQTSTVGVGGIASAAIFLARTQL